MLLSMSEILIEAGKLQERKKKIEYLQKHKNVSLVNLMKMMLDKNLKWALPEGAPEYKKMVTLDQEGNLYREMRRLYLFLEPGNTNLTQKRREAIFIQLLESLPPNDAELLINVKDHKLKIKGLTEKILIEAYPELTK